MDKHGGREINPQTEKDQSIRVAGTVIRRVFLFIIQKLESVVQSVLAFGEKQQRGKQTELQNKQKHVLFC